MAQIEVRFNNYPDHAFFDYMPLKNWLEVKRRIERKTSQIAFFNINGVDKFAAVLDFEKDCLHVREVGGNFPFLYKHLNNFCIGFAKALGMKSVSFKTEKTAVKFLAKRAGFQLNEHGDFEKAIA